MVFGILVLNSAQNFSKMESKFSDIMEIWAIFIKNLEDFIALTDLELLVVELMKSCKICN